MNIFTKLTILSLFLLSFQCTYVDKNQSSKKKKQFSKVSRKKKVVYLNLDLDEKIVFNSPTKYIF